MPLQNYSSLYHPRHLLTSDFFQSVLIFNLKSLWPFLLMYKLLWSWAHAMRHAMAVGTSSHHVTQWPLAELACAHAPHHASRGKVVLRHAFDGARVTPFRHAMEAGMSSNSCLSWRPPLCPLLLSLMRPSVVWWIAQFVYSAPMPGELAHDN